MKKYITIAALLAAGTAFANADDLKLSDATYTGTDDITLTTHLSSITAVVELDVTALKAVMLQGASLTKNTLVDFIDDDTNDIGLQTNYSSGGTSAIVTSGLWGIWNQNGAYTVGMNTGFEAESFWENAVAAAATLTYSYNTGTAATFSIAYEVDGVKSVVSYGGTWNTNLKGSTSVFDSVDVNTTFVSKAYVFDSVVTADNAKALSVAAVPEPSAFGLLAGLGALALVASRRRRK